MTQANNPLLSISQGVPFSPYLFMLCVKRLVLLINRTILKKDWSSIILRKNSPSISHLFFTNDLVLLSYDSLENAIVISAYLDIFVNA